MEGSRSVALHAAWAVDALPADDALAAGAVAKAYCARAARTVCETAIQVHGGIGNTWECLAHVYLRRALLSSDVLGGVGASLARVLAAPRDRRRPMDFGDSPDGGRVPAAAARVAARQQPRPAGVVDRRRLLGRPGRVAPGALRRRLLRHVVADRDRRPGPAERLRGDRRRRAGRRRRAAPTEPRLPRAGHPRARQRRHPAAGSCPASSTGATAGARASASPTPAPTSRRCAPAPTATATTTSSPGTRSGPATPTTPTGACCSPAPTTTCPSTRASRRSPCRCTSPASSSARSR